MTTAFVLSGGGSLGAVQVGMLQALGMCGIQPDLLVGTSAGAVNAVWVAQHGMSPASLAELGNIWQQLHRRDIFPVRATHVLGGFLGHAPAISSSEQLGELVRSHSSVDDLAEAVIPVHALATDLLTGRAVLISSGSPSDAVRASAAIPGVYPPVRLGDCWLIDGALATPAGVSHAVQLGATQIYALPAGVPCALASAPRSALGVALHAFSLLIQQRLSTELVHPPIGATIHLLPPLCPMTVSVADFGHAAELIDRSRHASTRWLEEGGPDLPHPARFLSLHSHGHTAP
ncbi:MAG: patatin-like phospholipase family protein [Nocardioides sp.]|nr:patatin-like phospholipase family protein [Nocardioides sp.]